MACTMLTLAWRSLVLLCVVCQVTGEPLKASLKPKYIHHNYKQMTNFLKKAASRYPHLTELISIGDTVEGRKLWVMRIGKNPEEHQILHPEVKYIGNMHGNEVISRELLIHFIYYLLTEYETNSMVTKLLDNTRVQILVSMNPDAWEWSSNQHETWFDNCLSNIGRFNANGVNLNRNFPDYFQDFENVIQPETQAVIDWMEKQQFVISASLHGGALLVNYAYDNYYAAPGVSKGARYSQTDDDDVIVHLSHVYAKSHTRMHTGYTCPISNTSFPDGIVNGAEWYYVYGGMQDYNYAFAGCIELTLEVSCCKYPPEDEVEAFWEENKPALINFLMEVFQGVKGLVMDADTLEPIVGAEVTVEHRVRHPMKTTNLGEYWKILLPGNYVLQVRAPGYNDKSVPFTVPVGANDAVRVDVPMTACTLEDGKKRTFRISSLTKWLKLHGYDE